jgi:hypothetical protein
MPRFANISVAQALQNKAAPTLKTSYKYHVHGHLVILLAIRPHIITYIRLTYGNCNAKPLADHEVRVVDVDILVDAKHLAPVASTIRCAIAGAIRQATMMTVQADPSAEKLPNLLLRSYARVIPITSMPT